MTEAAPHTENDALTGATAFQPGRHVGLVTPRSLGLIARDNASTRAQLWSLVSNDAPIDDVLDELSRRGIKNLPDFGLVQVEDEQVRIVTRGKVVVSITSTDGSERIIDPAEVRTWIEETARDVASVAMSIADDDGAAAGALNDEGGFFVVAGSVPASSLSRRFVAEQPVSDAAPAEVALAADAEERSEPAESGSADADAEPAPEEPLGAISAEDGASNEQSVADEQPVPDEQRVADDPVADDSPASPDEAAAATEETPATDVTDEAFADASEVEAPDSGVSADDVIIADLEESLAALDDAGHDADGHDADGHDPDGHDADGHDPAPEETAGDEVVPRIHAVLSFSNGDRIPVDRSILIGRNPKITGQVAELPRIMKYDGPGQGLSRTHAEIRVEGGQLVVEDMQSTNGTEVQLPGSVRARIEPGRPMALVYGAVLVFGDELVCDVEAPD